MPSGSVSFDEPVSGHSTIGIGGPAEAYVSAKNIDDLKKVIGWAGEMNVDFAFMGCGSKTIVRDAGIRGLLIHLGEAFKSIGIDRDDGEFVVVSTGSAVSVDDFVKWCLQNGLSGAERLLIAQGTLGGCLMTNARTDDGFIGSLVEEITIVNRERKELTLRGKPLKFENGKLRIPRTVCVTRVVLRLKKSDTSAISGRIDSVLSERVLLIPDGLKGATRIFLDAKRTNASDLIEQSGLKGIRIGRARVSTADANAMINEGGARSRDFEILIGLVRDRVREDTGLVLEPSIAIAGDRAAED